MQENVAIILFSVAMTCLAAFAIFVPLVIIPSIKGLALTYDFDHTPVHCVTVEFALKEKEDAGECTDWSFCKQGCEKPMTRCHQILVHYRKNNETIPENVISEDEWKNNSLWDETYTRLYVNAQGCGEAPEVRCNEFGEIISDIGRMFKCYYSRRNPRLVVIDPAWIYPSSSLYVTLGLPCTLLTVAIFIFAMLAVHFCPCVPTLERIKAEGVTIGATPQGRYCSIQNVNPTRA